MPPWLLPESLPTFPGPGETCTSLSPSLTFLLILAECDEPHGWVNPLGKAGPLDPDLARTLTAGGELRDLREFARENQRTKKAACP